MRVNGTRQILFTHITNDCHLISRAPNRIGTSRTNQLRLKYMKGIGKTPLIKLERLSISLPSSTTIPGITRCWLTCRMNPWTTRFNMPTLATHALSSLRYDLAIRLASLLFSVWKNHLCSRRYQHFRTVLFRLCVLCF